MLSRKKAASHWKLSSRRSCKPQAAGWAKQNPALRGCELRASSRRIATATENCDCDWKLFS